jgi:hypothetical protein
MVIVVLSLNHFLIHPPVKAWVRPGGWWMMRLNCGDGAEAYVIQPQGVSGWSKRSRILTTSVMCSPNRACSCLILQSSQFIEARPRLLALESIYHKPFYHGVGMSHLPVNRYVLGQQRQVEDKWLGKSRSFLGGDDFLDRSVRFYHRFLII